MTQINIRGSWDDVYKNNPVNKLPWYTKDLDFDLKKELKKLKKGSFLDLGTGPGTQAIALSKLGFDVTGEALVFRTEFPEFVWVTLY